MLEGAVSWQRAKAGVRWGIVQPQEVTYVGSHFGSIIYWHCELGLVFKMHYGSMGPRCAAPFGTLPQFLHDALDSSSDAA